MHHIESTIATALTGGPSKGGPRWAVIGTNHRGETLRRPTGRGLDTGYRDRYDATDFAAELNSKGGDVKVVRL